MNPLKDLNKGIFKAHSFIAIIKTSKGKYERIAETIELYPKHKSNYYSSNDNQIEIVFTLRENKSNNITTGPLLKDVITLILGDDSEWKDTQGQKCMANGVYLECDLASKELRFLTSIVGLPPLFVYKESTKFLITSDLYLFAMLPGLRLYFDPKGIIDICNIGHPINNRTLFRNVSMIQGGYSLKINKLGEITTQKAWEPPKTEPLKNWNAFTDLQIETFKHAIKNLDLSNSFLSLTAGLDTRAILAELIHENRKIPAYTMSGPTLSLDARIAKKLSSVYGIKHGITTIENDFYKGLPDYAIEASRLSGGLASIEQASEVYFYKKIKGSLNARLSGNLGNQIGRRGSENVSLRNADATILNEIIYNKAKENSQEHWYKHAKITGGRLDYEFLLQNEVPFSSVGNYCIGSFFSIQQSPYANHLLIENSFRMPVDKNAGEYLSLIQLRLNDLRHRFLGEPELYSFQRKLIKKIGGYVASCPINWGWRAKGGMSPFGSAMGVLTFIDAILASKGLDSGLIGKGLEAMHITGLHEFKHYKKWMNFFMKDFVCDVLLSHSVKESGLFNTEKINKIIEEHYSSKKCHYEALALALDLALSQQVFKSTL